MDYFDKVHAFSWGVLLIGGGNCWNFLDFDMGRISLARGGVGDFFLVDFLDVVASPLCFIRVRVLPILTNSCWFSFGWGFLGLEKFNFPVCFWGGLD